MRPVEGVGAIEGIWHMAGRDVSPPVSPTATHMFRARPNYALLHGVCWCEISYSLRRPDIAVDRPRGPEIRPMAPRLKSDAAPRTRYCLFAKLHITERRFRCP